jgi:hypothetical protein
MDGGEGSGTGANTRDRGDELSDTEMAPDDDLEREGVRVLDETSDLDEDKEEASTGSRSNTLMLKEVSPETEKIESQFPLRNSNCEMRIGKKSAIGEIELPQPPIARVYEPMTGSTNTKSCFPPQYFTIRATKQRFLAPAVLGGWGPGDDFHMVRVRALRTAVLMCVTMKGSMVQKIFTEWMCQGIFQQASALTTAAWRVRIRTRWGVKYSVALLRFLFYRTRPFLPFCQLLMATALS